MPKKINAQQKNKKSIRQIMGALKATSSMEVDEAIEKARIERTRAIISTLEELENNRR